MFLPPHLSPRIPTAGNQLAKAHVNNKVGLDIRPFSLSGRIPDIWLINNVGYPSKNPVIFQISNVGQISGPTLVNNHYKCTRLKQLINPRLSFVKNERQPARYISMHLVICLILPTEILHFACVVSNTPPPKLEPTNF